MKPQIFRQCLLPVLLVILLLPSTGLAWDAVGHKAIARIAWDNLSPQTRSRVIALLDAAPEDSDIRRLRPKASLPAEVCDREFFMAVSNWADFMREEAFPERRDKYHRSGWHFINFFFEQTQTGIRERTDLKPAPENVVERLQIICWRIGDGARSEADRAIDLAWILHLAGDIHQPLHSSARVTATEPNGDQGGNLFKLETRPEGEYAFNLHSYWDGIVRRALPKQPDEPEPDYLSRITRQIQTNYPKDALHQKLKSGEFSQWALEGYETTKAVIYPPALKRLEIPAQDYLNSSWQVAEPALALAGYRLAAVLERLFSN